MFKWLIVFLLLLFVYHVREVFPPFIVGSIIAYLLYPLVKQLNQKFGIPVFLAMLIIYLGALATVGVVAWWGWPRLVGEATNLFESRRETVTSLVDQVAKASSWNIDVHETSDIILSQVQNSVGKPEELMHFGGLISKSLLSTLICAVTSVYMLGDSRRVGRFVMRFIAPDKRATVVSLAGQMDVMFRKYIFGQILLIVLMSCVAFVIFTGCGLKNALLLAVVTGFLEIIPILGPMLAIMIASAFAVAQLGIANWWIVPLCLWIARIIEDYVIVPNTIGHAVELHPLAVIFAVIVGETMAGALGMLIAIPVAASIKVVLDFCYPPTSPVVPPKPHKNFVDSIIQTVLGGDKLDEQTARQIQDLETIEAMHEGAQGIALERTTAETDTVNRPAHAQQSESFTEMAERFKAEKKQAEPAVTATEKNQGPGSQGHQTAKLARGADTGISEFETLTGMAARVHRDSVAASAKSGDTADDKIDLRAKAVTEVAMSRTTPETTISQSVSSTDRSVSKELQPAKEAEASAPKNSQISTGKDSSAPSAAKDSSALAAKDSSASAAKDSSAPAAKDSSASAAKDSSASAAKDSSASSSKGASDASESALSSATKNRSQSEATQSEQPETAKDSSKLPSKDRPNS